MHLADGILCMAFSVSTSAASGLFPGSHLFKAQVPSEKGHQALR